MSQRSIPAGPEEVTPEWFTTVFRENKVITSGAVVGVHTEIIGQDRGFTGVITRVFLQHEGLKDEAGPASVVVKFPTATRGTPSAYRAVQEQDVARGRGAIDLALFLFGSLETTTRRAVENDLLRRYHELLVAGGVTGYSFPQLMKDCQLVLLWFLGAKVVWLGSIDLERLSGLEQALVDASLTEDSFTVLLDHNAGSLLPL